MATCDRFPSFVSWGCNSAETRPKRSSDDKAPVYEQSISEESDPSDETDETWSWDDHDSAAEDERSLVSLWADDEDEEGLAVTQRSDGLSSRYSDLESRLEQAGAYTEYLEQRSDEQQVRIAELEDLLYRTLSSGPSTAPVSSSEYSSYELESPAPFQSIPHDQLSAGPDDLRHVAVCEKLLQVLHRRVIDSLFLPLRALGRHYYPDFQSIISLVYNPATATAELDGHISHHVVDAFNSVKLPLALLALRCLSIVGRSGQSLEGLSEPNYDELIGFVQEMACEIGWTSAEVDTILWQCGEGFVVC